jgi:hypothetical protein
VHIEVAVLTRWAVLVGTASGLAFLVEHVAVVALGTIGLGQATLDAEVGSEVAIGTERAGASPEGDAFAVVANRPLGADWIAASGLVAVAVAVAVARDSRLTVSVAIRDTGRVKASRACRAQATSEALTPLQAGLTRPFVASAVGARQRHKRREGEQSEPTARHDMAPYHASEVLARVS